MFTTERLVLRAFRADDEDELLQLWDNPHVFASAPNTYLVPQGHTFLQSYKDILTGAIMHAILETKDTSEFIGVASITSSNPRNRDGMYGISIKPDFWGKGFGTEVTKFMVDHAFRWLGLHRLSLNVLGTNHGAIHLYQKMSVCLQVVVRSAGADPVFDYGGFVEEGRKRQSNWVNGAWEDVLSMGLLENEWHILADT